MERTVLFHVDMDSPRTLLKFWGLDARAMDLDLFFERAMERALTLFQKHRIPATFFCVGEDLEASRGARQWVRRAFEAGHEIANHTYSHPYGLTRLGRSSILAEIQKCSRLIEETTGSRPVGFRSPSCDIDNAVLNLLEEFSFGYDSSAWWNSLLPLMKGYHRFFSKGGHSAMEFGTGARRIPREAYFPDKRDWMRPAPRASGDSTGGILEIPISRTSWLGLPFYSNFHLLAGELYRRLSFAWMNHRQIVYLMHLVEFADLAEGIPPALKVHTNVSRPAEWKMRFLDRSIRDLVVRFKPMRTDLFAKSYSSR